MGNSVGYVCLLLAVLPTSDTRICGSVNARNNVTDLEVLRGCTVVEGFVMIALMEGEEIRDEDFDPYSFPELKEVTEYMVFYRVRGLKSLGKLFPSLERVGGSALVRDFALVVYEMFHLEEIGLYRLREITKGFVIVMKNPKLCFVNTVGWNNITKWQADRNYEWFNMDNSSCPSCPMHCNRYCWDATRCQDFETRVKGCHDMCAGHCSTKGAGGCFTCKGVYDLNGNCVTSCPNGSYKYLNRRCVTREECNSTTRTINGKKHSYIVHGDQCLDSCPPGYEPDLELGECKPCSEGWCLKWCEGAVISSTGGAQKLKGCTHINGSLEITITITSETSKDVHSVLEENLGSIERITGYLMVARSSLTDLNFFKNLSAIQGIHPHKRGDVDELIIIEENENLQELWDWEVKKNFTMGKGNVSFHYNPRLCLSHIDKLLDVIGLNKSDVSKYEVDRESNGNQFSCNPYEVSITVIDKTYDRIQLNVTYTKKFHLLRSVVYYVKDPHDNITVFDDFGQCSNNGWRTIDIHMEGSNLTEMGFKVNLTDLEPFTYYVLYVILYSPSSVGARSEMHRMMTLPGTPSEISDLRVSMISSSEVNLHWEPPEHVNGFLQGYVVTLYELNEDRSFLDQRNYCDDPQVAEKESYNPEVKPPIKVNNSCCSALQKPVLFKADDEFEVLCSNLANTPKGFPDRTKSPSGKSYFYSYIYKSPFHSDNEIVDNHFEIEVKSSKLENSLKSFTSKNLKRIKNSSTSLNDIHNYNTPADKNIGKNKPKPKIRSYTTQSNNFTIRALKHFQNYVLSVKACREVDKNEIAVRKSDINRCSHSEIITVRTKGVKESDTIPFNKVSFHYDIKNESLKVQWEPPDNPNGIIVAFEIEYRVDDVANSEITNDCLSNTRFEENGRKYIIYGLSPKKYVFRIRAITLYGKGPFTKPFTVENKRHEGQLLLYILSIFAVVFGILIIVVYKFLKFFLLGPSKYHMELDVNPLYHYVPDHYEINRDDVELFNELGTGSFGKVFKGLWKSKNIVCAVKTVSECTTIDFEREILLEASVMKSMVHAYHIVKIYGVVSRTRPPMVLMELMENGDLKTYLRNNRGTKDLLHQITDAKMIKMALEIADAMAYMEAHKYVHRDLAARNCLVSSDITIKVGDFGMARDIYDHDYYRKKNKGFLPIRWMAPESIKDGVFTSQSDVWSYGVVLWEIVTMAEQPYQGCTNYQVVHDVMDGTRLKIPENTPSPLQPLMEKCWRTPPSTRPSFMSILNSLKYYHEAEFRRVAYYYSREAEVTREGLWEYVHMNPVIDPPQRLPPPTAYRLAEVDEEHY